MPTLIAPLQIILAPGTAGEFAINREHQLNDATLTLSDMFKEHMTQESAAPADKSFTGFEAKLEISLAEWDLEFFRRATNPARYIVDTVDPTKKKIEFQDLTGLRLPKQQVLIRPYDGTLPTTNRNDWLTFLNAGIETNLSATFGKETQVEYKITFTAYPDPVTRVKVVRGDITAVST